MPGRLAVATSILLGSSLAHAQPGATPPATPTPDVGTAAPAPPLAYRPPGVVPAASSAVVVDETDEPVGIAGRAATDAAADRTYFTRTALTAPSGSFTLTVRAPLAPVFLNELTYSLGRVEVGLTAIAIPVDDGVVVTGGHVKAQLWRGRRAALAAGFDVLSADGDTFVVPALVASLCGNDSCRTLVSAHLTGLAASGEEAVPVLAGLSFAAGGPGAKFIGEAHYTSFEDAPVLGGFVGLRAGGRHVAVDAGLGFGVAADSDALAYPFFALNLRP